MGGCRWWVPAFSSIVIIFFSLKVVVLWRPEAAIMPLSSIREEACIGREAPFICLLSYRGCGVIAAYGRFNTAPSIRGEDMVATLL